MGSVLTEGRSYIAGRWVTGEREIAVENPADESRAGRVTVTPLVEVGAAIAEARRSFDAGEWAGMRATARARMVHAFLDHLESMTDELVPVIVAEAGQPLGYAGGIQTAGAIQLGRNTIDLYLSMRHEDTNPVPTSELVTNRVALSLRRHEPVGVVTAITPYNAALLMAIQKLVPALMAGNSVIVRPSPLTPISSLALGAAADAAGLPAGVLSVVVEDGAQGAELLTSDPGVDMVSFTGSTAVGKTIAAQAAPTLKRVVLELGGKSAQIYLPDALDYTALGAMVVVAMTSGQACVAATRMLVPIENKAEVLATVADTYAGLTIGDPSDPATMIGPLISASQRDRCEQIVAAAQEHGGTVVTGGGRPSAMEQGYYFEPTVLDLPDNANPAAQEEIFGPVLSVIGYDDVDHAVAMANDSIYGLSGQVYGRDLAAATDVARRIRSGAVSVNTSLFSAYAPSGGYKQSGLGRERGPDGIREFQEVKHVVIGELK
ncbi:MAG: aldehyde dehydrogenase family protein [Acidimicrobiia bacterium]|nr:aldehyde dehydrogenase family protein [Acidimicrobiia bacterium]